VLFGAVRCCSVLFGAVRCCSALFGAVRCCSVVRWSRESVASTCSVSVSALASPAKRITATSQTYRFGWAAGSLLILGVHQSWLKWVGAGLAQPSDGVCRRLLSLRTSQHAGEQRIVVIFPSIMACRAGVCRTMPYPSLVLCGGLLASCSAGKLAKG
jgi:hypothetical protein